MDDEIDEIDGNGPAADRYPVTYIWDIRDLEKPKQTGLYKGKCPLNPCLVQDEPP
jgi:hypothetical protein